MKNEEFKKTPLAERIPFLDFDSDELKSISDESFGQMLLLRKNNHSPDTNLSMILKDFTWYSLSPREQKSFKSIIDKISPATLNEYLRRNSISDMMSLDNRAFEIMLGKTDPALINYFFNSTSEDALTTIVKAHDSACIFLFLGAISPLSYIRTVNTEKFWQQLTGALNTTTSILYLEKVELIQIFTVLKDFLNNPIETINKDPNAVLKLLLKLPIRGNYEEWLKLLTDVQEKVSVGQSRDPVALTQLLERIKFLRGMFSVRLSDGKPVSTVRKIVTDCFETLSPEMVAEHLNYDKYQLQFVGECLFTPISTPTNSSQSSSNEIKSAAFPEVRNWINGMYFLLMSVRLGNPSAISLVHARFVPTFLDDGQTLNAEALSKEIKEKGISNCLQAYYEQIKAGLIKPNSGRFPGLYGDNRPKIPKTIYDMLKDSQIDRTLLLNSVKQCLNDAKTVKNLNSISIQALTQLYQVLLAENTFKKITDYLDALTPQSSTISSSSSSSSAYRATSSSSLPILIGQTKEVIEPLDIEEKFSVIKQSSSGIGTQSSEIAKLAGEISELKASVKELKDIVLDLSRALSAAQNVIPQRAVAPLTTLSSQRDILLASSPLKRSQSEGSITKVKNSIPADNKNNSFTRF